MNAPVATPIDAMQELRGADALGLADGVAAYCSAQLRAAELIAANPLWERQVRRAAMAVNADHVPHQALVERARIIVMRGSLYALRRNGRIVTFGASLSDNGGYVELRSRADPEAVNAAPSTFTRKNSSCSF